MLVSSLLKKMFDSLTTILAGFIAVIGCQSLDPNRINLNDPGHPSDRAANGGQVTPILPFLSSSMSGTTQTVQTRFWLVVGQPPEESHIISRNILSDRPSPVAKQTGIDDVLRHWQEKLSKGDEWPYTRIKVKPPQSGTTPAAIPRPIQTPTLLTQGPTQPDNSTTTAAPFDTTQPEVGQNEVLVATIGGVTVLFLITLAALVAFIFKRRKAGGTVQSLTSVNPAPLRGRLPHLHSVWLSRRPLPSVRQSESGRSSYLIPIRNGDRGAQMSSCAEKQLALPPDKADSDVNGENVYHEIGSAENNYIIVC